MRTIVFIGNVYLIISINYTVAVKQYGNKLILITFTNKYNIRTVKPLWHNIQNKRLSTNIMI